MKTRLTLFCILTLTLLALLGCAPAENIPEPTPTLAPPVEITPEVTPPASGDGLAITAVELAGEAGVERIDYRGNCPVSFQFEGTVYSQGAGEFTYQLRADSNDPNFEFVLPDSQTVNNPTADEHELQVIDSLEIDASVDGWVYLYISEPMEFSSNNVDLVVVCE